jgi:streptogramin lyase
MRGSIVGLVICGTVLFSGCGAMEAEDVTATSASAASDSSIVVSTATTTTSTTSTTSTTELPALPSAGGPPVELNSILAEWMAADDQGVWVKQGNGRLTSYDPITLEPTRQIDYDTGVQRCEGIGTGFGSVWSCADQAVVRFDASTGDELARVAANKTYTQGTIAAGFDRMWILLADGSTLAAVDPSSNAVSETFELPVRGTDLNVGPNGLWVVSTVDDAAVRVDPGTGAILVTVAILAPLDVAIADSVWIGTPQETIAVDPETGELRFSVPQGLGAGGAITADDTSVWIRNPEAFLTRLDAQTGAVVDRVALDTAYTGDVVLAHGLVWASAYHDDVLYVASAS